MRRAEASEPTQATAKRMCSRRRRVHPGRPAGARGAGNQLAPAEHLDTARPARRRDRRVVPSLSTPSTTSGHTR